MKDNCCSQEASEFKKLMNGFVAGNSTSSESATYLSPNVKFSLPDTVDWRTKGYVTPVKDQVFFFSFRCHSR